MLRDQRGFPGQCVEMAAAADRVNAWRKTGVLTDAQFISIRYSGKRKEALRLLRAGVSGILLNCISLAWVFRAMLKISNIFFIGKNGFPICLNFLARRGRQSQNPDQPMRLLPW
jgi:hypothetical protein